MFKNAFVVSSYLCFGLKASVKSGNDYRKHKNYDGHFRLRLRSNPGLEPIYLVCIGHDSEVNPIGPDPIRATHYLQAPTPIIAFSP